MSEILLKAPVLQALQNFRPRAADSWMLDNVHYRQRLERQVLMFPAFALPNSRAASCLTGLVHEFGVGELWMVTGEGFARDARKILPVARRLLAHLYSSLNLHRMHMLVVSDNAAGKTWAKHTGFTREAGPLKGMGPRGEDMDVFVYNRGENKK